MNESRNEEQEEGWMPNWFDEENEHKNRNIALAMLIGLMVLAVVVLAIFVVFNPKPAPLPPVIKATATHVETVVLTPEIVSVPVVIESPTFEPTIAPVIGYDYAGLSQCDNPDESVPLAGAVQNSEGLWEINIHENGCNLIFEGRTVPGERQHRVIVLRSANGEMSGYVQDGVFTYAEGSIWQKPREKNMEDVANVNDPAEALKLLNDKRAVMDSNGYDWPIWLYFTDGTTTEFGPGQTWEGLTAQNHCDIAEPLKINVHGEKITGKNQFSAAIGATNCITVAWIDDSSVPVQWKDQRDAANKVTYITIEAWLMPSSWDQTKIDSWVAAK